MLLELICISFRFLRISSPEALGNIIERFMNIYFTRQDRWDPLIAGFCAEPNNARELIRTGVKEGLHLSAYLATLKMRLEGQAVDVKQWVTEAKVIPSVEHMFLLTLTGFLEGLARGELGNDRLDATLSMLEALGADDKKKWGIKIMNLIDSGEHSVYSVRFRFAVSVVETFLQSQVTGGAGVRLRPEDPRGTEVNENVARKLKDLSSRVRNKEYTADINSGVMNMLITEVRRMSADPTITVTSYRRLISVIVENLYPDKRELSVLRQRQQ